MPNQTFWLRYCVIPCNSSSFVVAIIFCIVYACRRERSTSRSRSRSYGGGGNKNMSASTCDDSNRCPKDRCAQRDHCGDSPRQKDRKEKKKKKSVYFRVSVFSQQ